MKNVLSTFSFPIFIVGLMLCCLSTFCAIAQTPSTNNFNNLNQETTLLVQRLKMDKLINEYEGFLVEKRQHKLFINGKEQNQPITAKYLASLKEEFIHVQVFSFEERFKMHPTSNILQLLAPATFESPCIQKSSSKKPGC